MPAIRSISNNLLHLFFPHICLGCGSDILENDHLVCLHCQNDLPVTNFFAQQDNPVEKSFYGRMPIRLGGAAYFFTKDSMLQHLVFQLKYRQNQAIGYYMGKLMGLFLQESQRFNEVDILIPLPLNPRKEKRRGYNQATVLCKGIADAFFRPIADKAVIRKVYTETQTHLGRINRWQNMDGVFSVIDKEALLNKHILLVDDIVTTGATLEACGAEILKIPGTTLSIATLAYTI